MACSVKYYSISSGDYIFYHQPQSLSTPDFDDHSFGLEANDCEGESLSFNQCISALTLEMHYHCWSGFQVVAGCHRFCPSRSQSWRRSEEQWSIAFSVLVGLSGLCGFTHDCLGFLYCLLGTENRSKVLANQSILQMIFWHFLQMS